MKLKRLFLSLSAVALTIPAMMADSVTINFKGDAWQDVVITNANEYGANYGEYFHPDASTYVYECNLPFVSGVNAPGLQIGVPLQRYSITMEIDGGAGLVSDPDYEVGDYFLDNLSGGGGFSPASGAELQQGYSLSLYSTKMNGKSFTVTVNKVQTNDVTFNLNGYNLDAYTAEEDFTQPYEVLGEGFLTRDPGTRGPNVNNEFVTNSFTYIYTSPKELIFTVRTPDHGAIFNCSVPEGPDTWTLTQGTSITGDPQYILTLYNGIVGATFDVTVWYGQEPTDEPEPDQPSDGVTIKSLTPAAGSSIAGMLDGTTVTASFNSPTAPACVALDIWDDGEYVGGGWQLQNNGDGTWSHTFGYDYYFYEGHTYTGTFSLYSVTSIDAGKLIGSVDVTWNGSTPIPGSQTQLLDFEPPYGSTVDLAEDGSFTFLVNFTGPVSRVNATIPLGFGVSSPAEVTKITDTSWEIYVEPYLVSEVVKGYEQILVSIYAKDADGETVYENGFDYISAAYTPSQPIEDTVDFFCTLDGVTVDGPVDSFSVATLDGASISANDVSTVIEVDGQWVAINPYRNITVSGLDNDFVTHPVTVYQEVNGEEKYVFDGTVKLAEPIVAPGRYQIEFPVQAFLIGEEYESRYSMAKTVQFTVKGDVPEPEPVVPSDEEAWLFMPSQQQENLYGYQIVWGDYLNLTAGPNELVTYLTVPGETEDVEVSCRFGNASPDDGPGGSFARAATSGNSIISSYIFYSTPGEYTITIPEGIVNINGAPNKAQTLNFTLGKTMSIAQVLSPEADILNSIAHLDITWDLETVTLNREKAAEVYYIYNGTERGEVESVSLVDYDPNAEGGIGGFSLDNVMPAAELTYKDNLVVINLPIFDIWGKFGSFDIYIPAGLVKGADGLESPAQSFKFTLLPIVENQVIITPTPDPTVTITPRELSIVNLSWEGMSIAANSLSKFRLETPDGKQIELENEGVINYIYSDDTDEIVSVDVYLSQFVKADGTYSLVVPQEAFVLTNAEGNMFVNGEAYASWIVSGDSGVAGLAADENGLYVVYNVAGVNVLTTSDAQALRNLAPGLYIINGMKVLIRK